jgi:hypothetical protein
MNTIQGRLSSLFAGLYAWIVTIFFGMILLDIVYSNLVTEAETAYSEVSDFLLLIGFLTILAAMGAISLSWKSRTARNYFIASLIILMMEFLMPVFFSQFLQDMQRSALTVGLRILINGLASILALIGVLKIIRAG